MRKLRAAMEKFSFSQLTSNSDGKTSGSGTAGLYIVFIGGICFFLGCIDKMFININMVIITCLFYKSKYNIAIINALVINC
jgi:hypothetical protein